MTGIKDDHCWVCGGEGADTLCPKCGHIVCRDCYDEATHRCLECIEEDITIKATRKKVMLIGGLLLVIVGLSTAAAGIVAGIPSEGVTVIFPFLVGDVSPWVAGLYSFLFFLTISSASLLPWLIHTRGKPTYAENEDYTVSEGNLPGGENFEHVEYVITAELPKKLEKTILVESNGASIHLHSTADKNFSRNYNIPDGHDLDGLDYDYEEGYLVLRLHLIRVP
ncbi:MAG: hypothetical protein NTV61_00520 [Candidatus Bathyarchaeota archaeon]|nr:hypothetical protein [Candidatus Bathyarchaeota archaeon]